MAVSTGSHSQLSHQLVQLHARVGHRHVHIGILLEQNFNAMPDLNMPHSFLKSLCRKAASSAAVPGERQPGPEYVLGYACRSQPRAPDTGQLLQLSSTVVRLLVVL